MALIAELEIVEFSYPLRNLWGIELDYRWRQVRVEKRRRLVGSPLNIEAILSRPDIRRGSSLIVGIDVRTNEKRRFYVDAQQGNKLPAFRLGAFDPLAIDDSPEWLSRLFYPTHREWKYLLACAERLSNKDFGRFRVGAYPVPQ